MNDEDYIRKGVELADNFSIQGRNNYRIQEPHEFPIFARRKNPTQWFKAALAAQLVRQWLVRHTCTVYTEWHLDLMETIKWLVDNWGAKIGR